MNTEGREADDSRPPSGLFRFLTNTSRAPTEPTAGGASHSNASGSHKPSGLWEGDPDQEFHRRGQNVCPYCRRGRGREGPRTEAVGSTK